MSNQRRLIFESGFGDIPPRKSRFFFKVFFDFWSLKISDISSMAKYSTEINEKSEIKVSIFWWPTLNLLTLYILLTLYTFLSPIRTLEKGFKGIWYLTRGKRKKFNSPYQLVAKFGSKTSANLNEKSFDSLTLLIKAFKTHGKYIFRFVVRLSY